MGPVMLSFPADPAHVALARSTAAAIGADASLTIDQVEDLRLAVDEAVSQLIFVAPGSRITCAFDANDDGIRVTVTGDAASGTSSDAHSFDTDSFGWTVMGALVDVLADDTAAGRPAITLTMRRREDVPA